MIIAKSLQNLENTKIRWCIYRDMLHTFEKPARFKTFKSEWKIVITVHVKDCRTSTLSWPQQVGMIFFLNYRASGNGPFTLGARFNITNNEIAKKEI